MVRFQFLPAETQFYAGLKKLPLTCSIPAQQLQDLFDRSMTLKIASPG